MVSIWPTGNTPIDYSNNSYYKKDDNYYINEGTMLEYIYKTNPMYVKLIVRAQMQDFFNNPSNQFTFIMTPAEYIRVNFDQFDYIFARKIVNYSILPKKIRMADFGSLDEGYLRTNTYGMNLTYKKYEDKLFINTIPVIRPIEKENFTIFLVNDLIFKIN